VRRGVALLVSVSAVLVAAPAGSAAPPFASCGPSGLQCATLNVPLDYSGATPGQVPLYVEVLPAVGMPRGVMMLLAGGPGQASAETFDLGAQASYLRSYFPGYTLVAYDDRGTGKSGPLACPNARTVLQCGTAVPTRAFYTTRDHGEDIEFVRTALGVDKVALFGVSYGTKHAVAYALAHPSHVERLLLDSEVLPDRRPVDTSSIQTIPTSINKICTSNVCQGIPAGIGDRFATLANALQAHPVDATVHFAPTLAPYTEHIDGMEMLSLAYESDLGSAMSSELPAAIDAALAGSMLPLERLIFLDALSTSSERDINFVLLLATNCGDGPFPWQPADTPDVRTAAMNAAIAALPAGSSGAFGDWAFQSFPAWSCIDWPAPSGGVLLGPGPLPNVPVLVLSGDRDIRTPTSGAVEIAKQFPKGRVLLVPGAGHSVLNHSTCAKNAVLSWLNGGTPPAVCTRFSLYVPALGRWRASVATTPAPAKLPGLTGRTLNALLQTIHDAEDTWLMTRISQQPTTGLVGGLLTPDPKGSIRLQAYSSVGGLAATGTVVLKMQPWGDPVVPLTAVSGSIKVTGSGSAHGTVRLSGNRLAGTLNGRPVTATF
jgi:pimeloyl-ACP methyl ester carboxylesterase